MKKSVILLGLMVLVAGVGIASVRWADGELWRGLVSDPLVPVGIATASRFDPFYENMVASQPPQARAELALSLALRGQLGATDYIIENAAHWRGRFGPSPSLDTLVGLGQSSPYIEVRMATFELYLAAYDLDKSELQVDQQLATLAENPATGHWVMWTLGMIGARGVARERIFDELTWLLLDNEARVRSWAVTGLATLGGEEIIAPLLQVAATDNSMDVRQNAMFALAVHATLHLAERYRAIPGLLEIASDSAQDAAIRQWAYQVLREITEADFGDQADAWRTGLEDAGLLTLAR